LGDVGIEELRKLQRSFQELQRTVDSELQHQRYTSHHHTTPLLTSPTSPHLAHCSSPHPPNLTSLIAPHLTHLTSTRSLLLTSPTSPHLTSLIATRLTHLTSPSLNRLPSTTDCLISPSHPTSTDLSSLQILWHDALEILHLSTAFSYKVLQ
jgi:hypothetical protein